MHTVSMKELRPNLPHIIGEVDKKFERIIITKRGHPVVVMLSIDDYESIMETLDVLSDKPTVERIKKGLDEVRTGNKVLLHQLRKKIEHVSG
ncbi:MAG: type II toxin-antitoxin system Phd/YefM family antitoxin [Candidatus Omnitrophota bacterium]